ncbi:MAG: rRNA maturation RNase YbeY [Candidatus Acidiferrales bacterium]
MISNRQRKIRVSVPYLRKFISRLRLRLELPRDSFSVAFVSNSEIRRWNRLYRGKNRPTDVLSFPTDERSRGKRPLSPLHRALRPGSAANYLGDVAIAPAVARENARRLGRSLSTELRILILHGILHLMGYDHETDSGQMERRERRLRRELGLE